MISISLKVISCNIHFSLQKKRKYTKAKRLQQKIWTEFLSVVEVREIMPCTQAEDTQLIVFRQKYDLHKAKQDHSQSLPAKY